ncbi:F-box protein 31 [Steccherinum ochraceum]|uniref:F-box protein 31 n=1 Tax=Steccherinum ochraceum TaxID=92696 RepID=A0A4R0REW1_9APHY|nr:F-box protein 31 [Steccherinum ochraceum]
MSHNDQGTAGMAFASLPLEICLYILTFASGRDAINLLSTCRLYRSLVSNESLWRELCSRYGVHDLTAFQLHPGRTFFSVYTQLLHTYGPLLGLWASDDPFLGTVVEFRVLVECREAGWEGIVGEVWNFRQPSTQRGPILPDYYQFMSFPLPPLHHNGEADNGVSLTRNGVMMPTWTVHLSLTGDGPSTIDMCASGSGIRLNAPHRQAYYAYPVPEGQYHPNLHPTFPPPSLRHLWHDEARMPPMSLHHEEAVNHITLAPNMQWEPDFDFIPIFFAAPANSADEPSPTSISILPPPDRVEQFESLLSPWRHTDTFITDVFRHTQLTRRDATNLQAPQDHFFAIAATNLKPSPAPHSSSEDWSPRVLQGLWVGTCSTRETMVFCLKWEDEGADSEVQAWKVTGNCFVPRGAMAWKFGTTIPVPPAQNAVVLADLGIGLDDAIVTQLKMFRGVGVVSDEGFVESTHALLQLTVVIMNENFIRIHWTDGHETHHLSSYRRYPGRDIASEIVLHPERKLKIRRPKPFSFV